MKNPYQILGIKTDANDEMIRKAYLDNVRRYPPETAPEKFKAVREAYEKIENRTKRLRYYLLSTDCYIDSPIEALTAELEQCEKRQPPQLKSLRNVITQTFNQNYLKK